MSSLAWPGFLRQPFLQMPLPANPKNLAPVLQVLGVPADQVIFVGDTEHDRRCAQAAGCRFALAGWNPRAQGHPGDIWLDKPSDLLDKGLILTSGR